MASTPTFRVLFHGGAGVITHTEESRTTLYLESLRGHAQAVGDFITQQQAQQTPLTALDIVEFTVKRLENDNLYNAGTGAVYTTEETHELEASIMDGRNKDCGAASMIKTIRHPISVARVVLRHHNHNYLVGESAEKLAREEGLETVSNNFFDHEYRYAQLLAAKHHDYVSVDHSTPGLDEIKKDKEQQPGSTTDTTDSSTTTETTHKMGTVGCVVMYNGDVAAGTSTGGMTNKLSGRIGDSPLIGAGTYADNKSAAISCTGWGEEFMKHVAAYDVHARMVYGGNDLKTAAHGTLFQHLPHDTGGLIAVTPQGDYVLDFNTLGMYRGVVTSDGEGRVGIWKDEEVFSWKK